MRPIASVVAAVNHMFPSEPLTMLFADVVKPEYSVTAPVGVIRPISFAFAWVNQRLPLGPSAMPCGSLFGVIPVKNSVLVGAGASELNENAASRDAPIAAPPAAGGASGVTAVPPPPQALSVKDSAAAA